MPHQTTEAGQCGTFHFEIGNLITVVFELLDFFVLMRVCQGNTQFTSLRTEETAGSDGDASYHIISRYTVYRTNGLLYVYSNGKDSFDDIAASLGFRVKDLKKYNEVPEDFPLQKNDIVYLEKKKKKADKPNYDHVVQVGESMHSIAQKYGIQIKSLYKMNKKHKDYIPEEGDVLKLR